jgi:asparagine synthase (glutamine-hydrolysing)
MSVQFGRWNLDGKPVDCGYLERVGEALSPYGPDGGSSYCDTNISILYYAFHTTKEARVEAQPHSSASGAVITWDGRLDNRTDLISELCNTVTVNSTDVAIVAAAYERWGVGCFARLIGDWALSIWNPSNFSLVLAKDPIGTRHLNYSIDKDQFTWCTILDPLVLLAGKMLGINEEYIAGWFSMFPAAHLTPYVGIHAVPPSTFVLLRPGKHIVSRYWDFDPGKKIRYRTDAEYEEHFRTVFTGAVQRSLRSDGPILAELSGGRDSSSIVCVADAVIAHGAAESPRLDTLSMYDDSEPNWNERRYFTKVEEKRGRRGYHIDVSSQGCCAFPAESDVFSVIPVSGTHRDPIAKQFAACMTSLQNRVVLSGIGGDEVMGGVPMPTPEIQDLMACARFRTLTRQLKLWALEKRRPWLHLFWEAVRGFVPPAFVGSSQYMRPAPWLRREFVHSHWAALTGYPTRVKLIGPRPTFQDNVATLEALQRQLACSALPSKPLFEKRYPYLDRNLLEFMFALPREQVVRPAQRRSLMRRSLIGIVPDEILNRKRKAFVVRAPLVAISNDWVNLIHVTHNMVSSSLGIVDSERFLAVLQMGRRGEEIPTATVLRTLRIEGWLRNLRTTGIIKLDPIAEAQLWRAPVEGKGHELAVARLQPRR